MRVKRVMRTWPMRTAVPSRRETAAAALSTTKFCTAGSSSSSVSATESMTSDKSAAAITFPNIFIPLRTVRPF